jgi:hypothetical protein
MLLVRVNVCWQILESTLNVVNWKMLCTSRLKRLVCWTFKFDLCNTIKCDPTTWKFVVTHKVKMCMSFHSTNWPQPHILIRLSEKYWLGQNLSFNLHWHQWNRKVLMLTPDCGPSKHLHEVASRWVEYGLINWQAESVEQEQDHINNICPHFFVPLRNTDAVSK